MPKQPIEVVPSAKFRFLSATLVSTIALVALGSNSFAGTLFWSTSFNAIRKADVGGGGFGTIVDPIPTAPGNVGAVDVDRASGRIYWTISSGRGLVQSSRADGTDIQTHVIVTSPDFRFFSGLAIDQTNQHMYFADKRNNAIFRSDVNGANQMTIVPETGSPANGSGIQDVRLDVENGHIYWADNQLNRIRRANLNGTNVQDLVQTSRSPYDIDLDLVNGKVYWSELGSRTNSGAIRSANLDGGGVQTIVGSNLWWPRGVAVDPMENRLYWTDTWFSGPTDYPGTLQSSTLTGQNRQVLANFGFSPRPFALTFVVPEPTTCVLALAALCLAMSRRRSH